MEFLIGIAVLPVLVLPVAAFVLVLIASQRITRLQERLATWERDMHTWESRWRDLAKPGAASPVSTATATPAISPDGAAVGRPAPAPVTALPTAAAPPTPPPKPEPPITTVAVPAAPAAAPVPPIIPKPEAPSVPAGKSLWSDIRWEQFMGAKLFAWVGGLALFLAVAFSVKEAFARNLVSPEVQVALGFLTGIGLLVGGVALKRKAYAVTAQTLCGTGTVILYAVSFAANSHYHLTGWALTFALMVLVTATAFLLAVRLNAPVVAILGLVGGFLTPPLLSTGVDRPLGLFGYVAILDAGLIAVAWRRRWQFLLVLAAVGTVGTQLGWVHEFFTVEKVFIALAVFLGFNALFLVPALIDRERGAAGAWSLGTGLAMPAVTIGFAWWLLNSAELSARPGVVFSFLAGADLCVLCLVWQRAEARFAHAIAGAGVFLVLAVWSGVHLTKELLSWALGAYLAFAILHTGFPVVLHRRHPQASPLWLGHLFAPAALVLVLIPLFKELTGPWLLWPVVLLINLAAIALALLTGALAAVLTMLLLTMLLMGVWIGLAPATLAPLTPTLVVVGAFAVFFFVVGWLATARMAGAAKGGSDGSSAAAGGPVARALAALNEQAASVVPVPALSAALPFVLLIMTTQQLPLTNPSPVYGLAMLLAVLLLGLTRLSGVNVLAPVGLGCVLALEFAWHQVRFSVANAATPLLWNLAFAALFLAFPFCFRRALAGNVLPWATAALSGPLHFYLVHRVVKQAFPNHFMGLLPAAFAVPVALGLAVVVHTFMVDAPNRRTILAWFGASTLFFVTLIFPIQLDKQWITIGWAMEGLALLWLFRRLGHQGLCAAGVALLVTAFVRLALNPAVLSYAPRSETRIWNWFLYSYGLVSGCLLVGAWFLRPPHHLFRGFNVPSVFSLGDAAAEKPVLLRGLPLRPVLYSLGTVLLFLLLNLEIADYFSTGTTATFAFSGNRARDMSYSIAWALFALGLLVVGVWKRQAAARYAGLALLGATLLKLFLHDLLWLSALHRIGAFLGVAIISILASVLYQRFFAGVTQVSAKTPSP
jgi:uncharacterized membrane protein